MIVEPPNQPDLPEWCSGEIPKSIPCLCDELTSPTQCPRCVLERNEPMPMTKEQQMTAALLKIRELKEQLGELESWVVKETLAAGHSFTAPGVQALWSKGRKSYNYEAAAQRLSPKIIAKFTRKVVDYRKACEAGGLTKDFIPYTESEPRVTFRFKEGE